jgi:hypothetical protein
VPPVFVCGDRIGRGTGTCAIAAIGACLAGSCLTPGRRFPKHGQANAVSGVPRVGSSLPAEGWPSG